MGTLLDRYMQGDRAGVWRELRRLRHHVRSSDHEIDARAVVRAAMLRARENVETLIARLREQGYRFGDPWEQDRALQPHAPPDEQTPAFVEWLESRWGPLPLTARAWIEVVGDVNLLGAHPAWPTDCISDPLVVELEYKSWRHTVADRLSSRRFHEEEYETWQDRADDDFDPFALHVAPDALHKANISGGAPYGLFVPDESADASFRFDGGVPVPFVKYLNLAFEHGGFPGFAKRTPPGEARPALRALAEGLLPL